MPSYLEFWFSLLNVFVDENLSNVPIGFFVHQTPQRSSVTVSITKKEQPEQMK